MSASTATFIHATPFSAVYKVDGASGNDPVLIDYTDAPTLAHLVAGPLKAEIVKRLGALTALNLNGTASGRVRIYLVTGISDFIICNDGLGVQWVANGLQVFADEGGEGQSPSDFYIEVRFQHSEDR
jgi:hypothetical protein